MNYGAVATNYVGATAVARKDGLWIVSIRDEINGLTSEVECNVLINACGPEVDRVNIMAAKSRRDDLGSAGHSLFRPPHQNSATIFRNPGFNEAIDFPILILRRSLR